MMSASGKLPGWLTAYPALHPVAGAVLCAGAATRIFALRFVDLRYQLVQSFPIDLSCRISGGGAALLWFLGVFLLQRRYGRSESLVSDFWAANFPMAVLAAFYWCELSFASLILVAAIAGLCAGRVFARLDVSPFARLRVSARGALITVSLAVLAAALWGAWWQYFSFSRLAMQWLDWGHYFEALNNVFKGRPLEINNSGGSFLGARFCPSLIVLLPVVALQSEWAFFFAGSLLVCSGAIFVLLIARELGMAPREALGYALWYLVIPGIVNLNLPLLDGFHEVLMFFPVMLAVVWCWLRKWYPAAVVLILFSFGIRETIGFMWFGWGVALILHGRRRLGAILAAAGLIGALLVIGVLMPCFNPPDEVYIHTSFFPQLGGSVAEIALSPVLRPREFFGSLFTLHNFFFWLTLFLPFIWMGYGGIWCWVALLPDLLMVSVDNRFDSQTVLRHYQAVMVIVLVVSVLMGAKRLNERLRAGGETGSWWLGKVSGAAAGRGRMAGMWVSTLFCAAFFTQTPGLPGWDPRLFSWSDARPLVAEFAEFIEPGAELTAGPRIASHFIMRNEVFIDYDDDPQRPLRRYVFVEGFSPMYGEDRLGRKLLASPDWQLLHHAYLDERLLLLFERVPGVPKPPVPVTAFSDEEWSAWGRPIPSPLREVELRGAVDTSGLLIIAARLCCRIDYDLGFRVTLRYLDGGESRSFISFGGGIYPALFAAPGEVYQFTIRPEGVIDSCRVDLLRL